MIDRHLTDLYRKKRQLIVTYRTGKQPIKNKLKCIERIEKHIIKSGRRQESHVEEIIYSGKGIYKAD